MSLHRNFGTQNRRWIITNRHHIIICIASLAWLAVDRYATLVPFIITNLKEKRELCEFVVPRD